jgi:glucose dehydrogenase
VSPTTRGGRREGPRAHATGAANTWSVIGADPGRDLAIVPTSSPSPDYYGGERRGANLYANSVVALRASTGARVWHFQVVHHDLWDYDIAAPPALVTVRREGAQELREVPLGTTRDLFARVGLPLAFAWGTPNLDGPIATAGGLVFVAAAMDNYLRAFDVETGRELWKGRLPAGGQATPMTYRATPGGLQCVVIAAGGHGKMDTTRGDHVVAFALPEEGRR